MMMTRMPMTVMPGPMKIFLPYHDDYLYYNNCNANPHGSYESHS